MKLSIIDVNSSTFGQEFSDSLRDTGFAVIQPDIDLTAILEDFYHEWKVFFESNTKSRYNRKEGSQRGYFGMGSEKSKDSLVFDLKEFYHIYDKNDLPFGINHPTLVLRNYLSTLGGILLSSLDSTMPTEISGALTESLESMIQDTNQTLFRVINYPPLRGTEQEGAVRAGEHEDINLITLLPAATESGLQVLTTEGDWYEVPTKTGTIVVNAGDMLQEATCGYYKSTTHRVINPTGSAARTSRLSAPLFVHPRPEVKLSSNYTAEAYLMQRLKEIGIL